MSKYNLFSRLLPQIWHMYKYVLKHPFRQGACHEKSNMDKQLPYFYTDNFSCYLIVGYLLVLKLLGIIRIYHLTVKKLTDSAIFKAVLWYRGHGQYMCIKDGYSFIQQDWVKRVRIVECLFIFPYL